MLEVVKPRSSAVRESLGSSHERLVVFALRESWKTGRVENTSPQSIMSISSLVRVQWLYQQALRAPKHLRILDGSWHLPSENRDPKKEFQLTRIQGARFFDIEECVDKGSPYEHMIPRAEDFANYVKTLGISNDSHVVVYDNNAKFGLFSAPRVWWTFRAFGHDRVSVLDGGLPRWLAEGYPTESGPVQNAPVEGTVPLPLSKV